MERKFLEGLGLEKETIDKIMTENGKDIETHKAAVTAKETELTTANDALKALQETVKKYDGKDPDKLENDIKALRQKYDADLNAAKLSSAVDLALTGAKAKNLTAAKALLKLDAITQDGDKIIGLDDQIKAVVKENPFLFGGEQPNPPPPVPGSGAPTQPAGLLGALQAHYDNK